jgi:hypothetical protein
MCTSLPSLRTRSERPKGQFSNRPFKLFEKRRTPNVFKEMEECITAKAAGIGTDAEQSSTRTKLKAADDGELYGPFGRRCAPSGTGQALDKSGTGATQWGIETK